MYIIDFNLGSNMQPVIQLIIMIKIHLLNCNELNFLLLTYAKCLSQQGVLYLYLIITAVKYGDLKILESCHVTQKKVKCFATCA